MKFGDWAYTCDRVATAEAYAGAESGYCDTCTCSGCRNFMAVREKVFPEGFVLLLESLGIDPHKDGEVYHNGPAGSGCHSYGGWFHFIGLLDRTGDFPMVEFGEGFKAWMCTASAPRLDVLRNRPVVQLEFLAMNVPWVLDESERP